MRYYHIVLSPNTQHLSAIDLPFGKYEYQQIHMELFSSPDIFQEMMSELMAELEFIQACMDDILVITKGTFNNHLEKPRVALSRLQETWLNVNVIKSFFARESVEDLGYMLQSM
jgi:hypothetical protein